MSGGTILLVAYCLVGAAVALVVGRLAAQSIGDDVDAVDQIEVGMATLGAWLVWPLVATFGAAWLLGRAIIRTTRQGAR